MRLLVSKIFLMGVFSLPSFAYGMSCYGEEKSILRQGVKRNHENEVANSPLVTFDIAVGNNSRQSVEGVSFVSIDLETTGLDLDRDQITEIAAIRYVDGHPESAFISLVKPSEEIKPRVEKVTGITNEMVQRAEVPTIDQLLQPLADFLGSDVIVAHHAPFEAAHLSKDYERYGLSRPDGSIIDTKTLSKKILPQVKTNLWVLVKHFKIQIEGPLHRAEGDAYCCGEILLGLLDKISQESQVSRAEALRVLADNPEFYLHTVFDRVSKQAGLNSRSLYPFWLHPSDYQSYRLQNPELFPDGENPLDRDPWDIFSERYPIRD